MEAGGINREEELKAIFGPDFLMKRPLLQAIDASNAKTPVLLIDELDRSDEEFEAYLLELLSDFQITIPEIGTITAKEPPVVIMTSNRTREIHDALRRRCLYYWIDFPSLEKEYSIVLARMPGVPERLAKQVCAFVRELRSADLFKAPAVAETLNYIDVTNKEDFYNTLKCSLLARHEQEPVFNQMFLYYWYTRDRQNKKAENPTGAAKRDERQLRLPPSERKRLAEHMNANEQQRKDLRPEMRETERRRRRDERFDEQDDDDDATPQGTAYSAIEMLRKKDFESFRSEEH